MTITSSNRPHAAAGLTERSYRTSPWLRWPLGLLFGAFAAGAVAVGLLDLAPDRGLSLVLLMGAVLTWFGWSMARRRRVTIDAQGIALVEWSRPRRLELAELQGYRRGYHNNAINLFFVPRLPGARPLVIRWMASMDASFEAWLRLVPELDAPQGEEAEARRAFDRDRPVARRFNRVALAVAAGALVPVGWQPFHPDGAWPWASAAALLMPVLSILLVRLGRGRFTLLEGKQDPRPTVFIAFILPGVAALLPLMIWLQLLSYARFIAAALGCAGLLCLAAWRLDVTIRGRRALMLLLLLPVLASPTAAALLVVNCAADSGPGATFESTVIAKRHLRGKGGGYFLDLAPGGPLVEQETLRVSWPVFDGARVGSTVPLHLRPGLLGFPWVWVG